MTQSLCRKALCIVESCPVNFQQARSSLDNADDVVLSPVVSENHHRILKIAGIRIEGFRTDAAISSTDRPAAESLVSSRLWPENCTIPFACLISPSGA